MHREIRMVRRLFLVLLLLCLPRFVCLAAGQEQDVYASGLRLVPKSDPAYKDAAFLSNQGLLRGCPDHYFSGRPLRTRYDFAVNISRILKRLKTGLLDVPETFPYPYFDLGPVGGATLKEWKALSRLYKEFAVEVSGLGDDPNSCEKFLARLEEIAIRTDKIHYNALPGFGQYRIDPYLEVAIALQAMGKEKACETLLTMARTKGRDWNPLFILCRMLFTARGENKFRRPMIGQPFFPGNTDIPDWPLEPIEVVDGLPFMITTGYSIGGLPESAASYVKYCVKSCDWNPTHYRMKSQEEKKRALEKLIASPKWKKSLTNREQVILALQLAETKDKPVSVAFATSHPFFLNNHSERIQIPGELEFYRCLWYSRNKLIGWFGRSNTSPQLKQFDRISGKIDPLPDAHSTNQDVWVSPDGQRLLTLTGYLKQWVVIGLDGHQYEQRKAAPVWVPLRGPMNVAWLPDSSAWVQMEPGENGLTMHLYRVGSTRSDSDSRYLFPGYPKLIGFPDPSHVLSFGESGTVDTYLLKDKAVLQKSLSFGLPHLKSGRSTTREVTLSPDLKRLCWLVLSPYDTLPAVLSSLRVPFPKTGDLARHKSTDHADATVAWFWTTALDGTNTRMISHITLDKVSARLLNFEGLSPDPLGYITPYGMAWSHEGDHITYWLNGKFWAITIPKEEMEKRQ